METVTQQINAFVQDNGGNTWDALNVALARLDLATARLEAAEAEVERLRAWQGHPDELWEARCTVVVDDGMVVVGGTKKAVDSTIRQLRRRVTAEAEVTRLREALAYIAEATNVDDPESYRCDDREGCLDWVYAKALAALDNSGQDAAGG